MVVRHQNTAWDGNYLPIQRPKKGLEVELIVLRTQPLYLGFHWWGRQSHLCAGKNEGCPGCEAIGEPRCVGTAIVGNTANPRWRALIELSPPAWTGLARNACNSFGSEDLFAARITVEGAATSRRAPIVQLLPTKSEGYDMAEEEVIFRRGVALLHRLPQINAYADIEGWEKVCIQLLRKRWERLLAEVQK